MYAIGFSIYVDNLNLNQELYNTEKLYSYLAILLKNNEVETETINDPMGFISLREAIKESGKITLKTGTPHENLINDIEKYKELSVSFYNSIKRITPELYK